MRKVLASAIGVLLVSALIAAGLQSGPVATASQPSSSAVTPAGGPLRSTGLPSDSASAGVASSASPVADGKAGGPTTAAPRAASSPTVKRTFPTASPAQFNVARAVPRVDERLTAQLAAAAPTDRLTVLVHAADANFARQAAEGNGLSVAATFAKVGVVAAVGTPEGIRSLSTVRGISYLEGDQPLSYFQETSHKTTRGAEAREGFSVNYEEPQPDIAGTSRQECTTKKNKRGRVVRDRRGRPVQTCRTVTTPPQPQPPVTRTLTSPGVDGSGVTVAVIDTGVDAAHPMFQQGGKSKVVQNLKFVGVAQCVMSDTCGGSFGNTDENLFVPVTDSDTISLGGHGTHVAGIAAGVDVTTADGKKVHGAAPGAKVVSLSVGVGINLFGASAALNWVLEHHRDPCGKGACPPIKVTNNSYGLPGGDFDPESTTAKLQRALVTEGVVSVWANGNGDDQNVGGDGSDNRSNPSGQDPTPGILSVANYDDAGAANRDNLLDSSSSRGEKGRPLTYPDLSAPGSDILSACRPQLAICRGTGNGTSDPNYGVISGTSMAAPHVAGIVAQLFQANPNLTPAEVEDALEDTARPFAFGGSYEPDVTNDGITSFDKGHGLVDVVGAVARARQFPFFPAGSTPCLPDGPVLVDPEGDATNVVNPLPGRPVPSNPALDVLDVRLGWSGDALSFRIRVKDLGTSPSSAATDGEDFRTSATLTGRAFVVNASRGALGTRFSLTPSGPNEPVVAVAGSFDPGADTVTVTVPVAAFERVKLPLPSDGSVILGLSTLGRRSLGVLAPPTDEAGAQCPYTLGLGAVPPPAGTTTGPDPAPKPPAAQYQPGAPEGTVAPGGSYGWKGAAFTEVGAAGAADGVVIEGTPCDYTIRGTCDDRYIRVEVPAGGATLTAAIKATNAGALDLDLYVLDPQGKEVGRSATEASTEKVTAAVSAPGVYTIRIVHFVSVQGTYDGLVTLT